MERYGESYWQRWKRFRPSKVLWLWSCAGVFLATVIVGFWHIGWVTGGTAQNMAEAAADDAKAQLVARVCVERYVNGESFDQRLAELMEASRWGRDDQITEGDWVALPGVSDATLDDAAGLCAERLATMDAAGTPGAGAATTADDGQA